MLCVSDNCHGELQRWRMSPYVLATINAKARHLDIAVVRHRDQANIFIGGFEVAVTTFPWGHLVSRLPPSTPGVVYFFNF